MDIKVCQYLQPTDEYLINGYGNFYYNSIEDPKKILIQYEFDQESKRNPNPVLTPSCIQKKSYSYFISIRNIPKKTLPTCFLIGLSTAPSITNNPSVKWL